MWTDERVEQLKQFWDEGLSCSRIAERMNCGLSRNAVIGKATRLKLPGRLTEKRKARTHYRSGPASYEEKQRLEAERLRPVPRNPDHPVSVDELFTALLDVISAECSRAGMLPRAWQPLEIPAGATGDTP